MWCPTDIQSNNIGRHMLRSQCEVVGSNTSLPKINISDYSKERVLDESRQSEASNTPTTPLPPPSGVGTAVLLYGLTLAELNFERPLEQSRTVFEVAGEVEVADLSSGPWSKAGRFVVIDFVCPRCGYCFEGLASVGIKS
ncbi:hypothetical protein J6590_003251 [Homalodisca vitripennis]|nr:hypothetical protein J6590_003251 [Homalodisca vitripennis]